jgi:hypothetical protein
MHYMWGMFPEPVDEGQANHSDIKYQDIANVGDTSVEGFRSLLSRGNAQNCLHN